VHAHQHQHDAKAWSHAALLPACSIACSSVPQCLLHAALL